MERFGALLFEDGKVIATGDAAVLRSHHGDSHIIDGHGRTLLPGLIDAHGHVLDLGLQRVRIDLTGSASLAEAQARIRAYAHVHPKSAWLQGGGWNQEIWKLGRFPEAGELDAAVSDRPVVLDRIDGHAKLFADGALGSRGAALLAPYSDRPDQRGLLFMSDAEMQHKIETALRAGYQVNIHAIGDAANHQVLDAFDAAYRNVDGRALRNRVEHAQVVALSDIPRFKQLALIASMQPTHATSDMNMAEKRIGPERLKGAYAWRSFLEQGTPIAGGSDWSRRFAPSRSMPPTPNMPSSASARWNPASGRTSS